MRVGVVVDIVGGVVKGSKQHIVELVKQSDLETSKQKLDDVTALHIYCLQPALPKSTAELWNSEREESLRLFEDNPRTDNCLRDNRFSSIAFEVIRDPTKEILNTTAADASTMKNSMLTSKSAPVVRKEDTIKPTPPPVAQKKFEPKKESTRGKQSGRAKMVRADVVPFMT